MSKCKEGRIALYLLLYLPNNGQDWSKGDLADNVLPEVSTALVFLCSKFSPGQVILNISPRIQFPARVGAMRLYSWLDTHCLPPPNSHRSLTNSESNKTQQVSHTTLELGEASREAEESAWWSLRLCVCHWNAGYRPSRSCS